MTMDRLWELAAMLDDELRRVQEGVTTPEWTASVRERYAKAREEIVQAGYTWPTITEQARRIIADAEPDHLGHALTDEDIAALEAERTS